MAKFNFPKILQKFAYNLSGFRKYGLQLDDILSEHLPEVREALKRLPENLKDERNFRLLRATQLSINKIYLPKSHWTKFEDDKRYLKPYIEEVKKEMEERSNWQT